MIDTKQYIINGDAANIPLPDGTAHAVVTSPPYFGLRAYAGQQERDWPGGTYAPMTGAPACVEVPPMRCGFGSEPTVEAYVWHSLLVLRECRRVLRDDGVCFLNLGDSFATTPPGNPGAMQSTNGDKRERGKTNIGLSAHRGIPIGLSQGNLIGIPARVMLAAQADGWTVRQDAVWAKVAPMPESVKGVRWERHRVKVAKSNRAKPTSAHARAQEGVNRPQGARDGVNFADHSSEYRDCPGCAKCEPHGGYVLRRGSWRHTRAHEFVFMLTKGMNYFSDGEAVREASVTDPNTKASMMFGSPNGKNDTSEKAHAADLGHKWEYSPSRNPRSVLTPRPSAYSGNHFAVFPPDLIAPLMRASVPRRCCPACGAGWAAVVENHSTRQERKRNGAGSGSLEVGHNTEHGKGMSHDLDAATTVTGYRPTCDCGRADSVPGTVLDPFAGSGTTLMVARELGVNGIGIDISIEYLESQAKPRGANLTPAAAMDDLPMFAGLD